MAAQALADIDRASKSYYLIGYKPVNPEDDGRYRRVEVRVARRDVSVRYANGYYATGHETPPPLPELLAQSRIESALDFNLEAKDITVRGTATFGRGRSAAGDVQVSIAIESSQVGFEMRGGAHSVRLGITMLGMNSKNQFVGGGGGTMTVDANGETFANYQLTGIPASVNFPVSERPTHVKVIVYSFGNDRMGTLNLPVK
jgi:hypothetical protein